MSVDVATNGRSACLNRDGKAVVEATAKIRPLGDKIVVEPLNVVHSRYIITHEDTKPLRGIVKAVGPGCFPKLYDHPDKHTRTKMWDSKIFRPTTVKVGDVIEFGGYEYGGYKFDGFFWGDVYHLWMREEDVSGIVEGLTADEAREESRNGTA